MNTPLSRRTVLSSAAAATAASVLPAFKAKAEETAASAQFSTAGLPEATKLIKPAYGKPLWEVGVAQWSLRAVIGKKVDNRDFGRYCKEQYDVNVIEWVNGFFKDKANNVAYLRDMKVRCDDVGVRTNLIMVDGEGALGDPDNAKRQKAIENHYKWIVACKLLGGHAIRVNARSGGNYQQQLDLAADGLAKLTEFARPFGISVCVENHGSLSSNAKWLTAVIDKVGMPECGILPDFGNCGRGGQETERYSTIDAFMPYAQSVSVKSWKFEKDGSHNDFDITRLMRIVNSHGWHGVCAVESEGAPGGTEAVKLTIKAMKKAEQTLRKEMGI